MKLYLLLIVLVCCVASSAAQESVTEPEFADVFFQLDAGKLVPLERQTAVIQGKASGFIVMSTKASSEFPGPKSPVRLQSGQSLVFVVRSPLAATTVDPNTFFVLRRLGVKKKTRELIIMSGKVTPLGGSTKSDLAEGVLPVTFVRYGSSSIKNDN
jgi:hypothetical protein